MPRRTARCTNFFDWVSGNVVLCTRFPDWVSGNAVRCTVIGFAAACPAVQRTAFSVKPSDKTVHRTVFLGSKACRAMVVGTEGGISRGEAEKPVQRTAFLAGKQGSWYRGRLFSAQHSFSRRGLARHCSAHQRDGSTVVSPYVAGKTKAPTPQTRSERSCVAQPMRLRRLSTRARRLRCRAGSTCRARQSARHACRAR